MKKNPYIEHTSCRICGNSALTTILNLGHQELSGVFPTTTDLDPPQAPLDLIICDSSNNDSACGLVQLRHSADISMMYGTTYGYHSSLSFQMVEHLSRKVDDLIRITNLRAGDKVLDIGCNDGTMLNEYSKHGSFHRFGIDPSSEKFRSNFEKDIAVAYEFFSADAIKMLAGVARFKIITSIAMFYDLDNPRSFVSDIAEILDDDGVWALELSYYPIFLKNLSYDQVCHEHVAYYCLDDINGLCKEAGLRVLDLSFNDMNGGSIYLKICKTSSRYLSNTRLIESVLMSEKWAKSDLASANLRQRVENHRVVLVEFLRLLRAAGKRVFGYGASTKGNIVLNYCGIDENLLPMIGDLNHEKAGRKTPGSGIPIVSHSDVMDLKPDYLLVLVWHLRSEVIKLNINFLRNGGRLIFALPIFHIVDITNYNDYMGSFHALSYSDSNLESMFDQLGLES